MSYQHLSMDERNVIFRMKLLGHRPAEIAGHRGRRPLGWGGAGGRHSERMNSSYIFA